MKNSDQGGGNVNRRKFMATAATVGASATLAGRAAHCYAQSRMSVGKRGARRVGISEAAYQAARRRAAALVARMTLAEKISQTGEENNGSAVPAIKRLGIPAYKYYSGEALHGLVWNNGATGFPLPLAGLMNFPLWHSSSFCCACEGLLALGEKRDTKGLPGPRAYVGGTTRLHGLLDHLGRSAYQQGTEAQQQLGESAA